MKHTLSTILEFNRRSVRIVQAETTADGVRLIALGSAAVNAPDGGSKEQGTEALSGAVKTLEGAYGIRSTRLTVVLPRHQVFMRRITIPPGNEDEVRGMLRFEAEKYLPFPLEKVVMDFFPCGALKESEANDVMLVAAKRETVEKYLEVLAGAGLFPGGISVSPVSLSNLFQRLSGELAVDAALIVNDGDALEIDIFVDKQLAHSRGMAACLSGGNAAVTVMQEVRNTLNAFGSGAVTEAYCIAAKENEELFSSLPGDKGIHFHALRLDAAQIKGMASPAGAVAASLDQYARLLGMAFDPSRRINLIPADVLDRYRRKTRRINVLRAAGIAAVSVVLLLAVWFPVNYRHSSGRRELAKKMRGMEPEIMRLRQLDEKLAFIDGFSGNRALPLRILQELSGALPRNAYLHEFRYDAVEGTLVLRGRANSFATASKVAAQMNASPFFSQVVNKGARMTKAGDLNLVDFEVECLLKDTFHNEKTQ